MTIGNDQNLDIQPEPQVSSDYVDALLRQLSPDAKADLLQKHAEQTLPVVVEDKPENKLANINYQEYGLNRAEFNFVLEYFGNGYNALQAYLTVHPHVQWKSAKARGHAVLHKPIVAQFIAACMDAIGLNNQALERRLESMIDSDPLDAYEIVTDEKGKEHLVFNLEKAKELGLGKLIKSIKPGRFGMEVSFVTQDKLLDIMTKVRGMQKKVSITGDLHKIAEGNDLAVDDLQDMLGFLRKETRPQLVAKMSNGIEIYQDES